MPKFNSKAKPLVLKGEDGCQLSVGYDNRGEPFREGVRLAVEILIDNEYAETRMQVMLEVDEVRQLRDKLSEYLGDKK